MGKLQLKTEKAVNILINIFMVLVILVALTAMLFRMSVFGLRFYAVRTGSMDGGYQQEGDFPPSFKPGDLILVKSLTAEQKRELKPGQIISFYTMIENTKQINTHRILRVEKSQDGEVVNYITAGDYNLIEHFGIENRKESISEYFDADSGYDYTPVSTRDILGVYSSKAQGIGAPINFIQSPKGFLSFVVVPCIIILLYSAFIFFKALDNYKKEKYALIETEKDALNQAKIKQEMEKFKAEFEAAERERIRKELLDDINKNN